MGLPFQHMLMQLRHLLWIGIWVGTSVLLWIWSPVIGVIFFVAGLVVYQLARRRGAFSLPPESTTDKPRDTELEARFVVTQVLKGLVRTQVAYLCQSFSSAREGQTWLKRALPRPYRKSLDAMHGLLERARRGDEVPELALAQQVLARRQELLDLIEALNRAHQTRPTFVSSNPVIFIITAHLSTDPAATPKIVTLAGWNPSEPTLLPQVEVLTLFSELEGKRLIRGQAEFEATRHALGAGLTRLPGEPPVYAVEPVEDPARQGVKISKVPLGFTIGAAELV